ncbi:MAG TPA: hypoxanthine phosphoribosyltransferase [Candidatus Kapabacteria bacterium]|nr:hypoxanthine phosphoribosyltransferase [Candidatus Kapabacteria bacterium]
MIDQEVIAGRIAELGAELTEAYAGRLPLLVGVLNGAAPFHADLARAMEIPLTVDFLRVGSYGNGMSSSGTLDFTAECSTLIAGRNVIIVEDIVDTGRTIRRLREYFAGRGAASVAVAAMLYKQEADLIGIRPEYVGFTIPDRFVVGFGLDYRQEGRNLRHVYVLEGQAAET